jgi:guanyl-specific ribonuclease Sa
LYGYVDNNTINYTDFKGENPDVCNTNCHDRTFKEGSITLLGDSIRGGNQLEKYRELFEIFSIKSATDFETNLAIGGTAQSFHDQHLLSIQPLMKHRTINGVPQRGEIIGWVASYWPQKVPSISITVTYDREGNILKETSSKTSSLEDSPVQLDDGLPIGKLIGGARRAGRALRHVDDVAPHVDDIALQVDKVAKGESKWALFARSKEEADAFRRTVDQIEGRKLLPSPALGGSPNKWGSTFNNRPLQPGRLPELPASAAPFKEYTALTPDALKRGPLRVVKGDDGSLFNTWTHYGEGQPYFPLDPKAALERVPFFRFQ